MSWLSNIFTAWPKRLPEGVVIKINVEGLIVCLCGKNHPLLDQDGSRYMGGSLLHGPMIWLAGYENKDGSLTIASRAGWHFAGHELQHQLRRYNDRVANPDREM